MNMSIPKSQNPVTNASGTSVPSAAGGARALSAIAQQGLKIAQDVIVRQKAGLGGPQDKTLMNTAASMILGDNDLKGQISRNVDRRDTKALTADVKKVASMFQPLTSLAAAPAKDIVPASFVQDAIASASNVDKNNPTLKDAMDANIRAGTMAPFGS